MVEYLDGGRIQGSSTLTVPPAKTSWKELDRVTLGSTGDTLDTSTFTAKDNIMFQFHILRPSSGDQNIRIRFNGDSGSNYSELYSLNGGTDATATSQANIALHSGVVNENFGCFTFVNTASKEKLCIGHVTGSNADGAGNAPSSREQIFKWANTSDQVTRIEIVNTSTGDFEAGSELVVLGCDNDEADGGTPYWERLADFTQTTAGDAMDTGTFTSKKYLWIQVHEIADGALDMNYLRFNADSGNNYSFRKANNGAASDTNTSISGVLYATHNGSVDHYAEFFIVNKSDKEKLITGTCTDSNSNNQEPRRKEFTSKWVNTSSQITSVQTANGGSGNIGVGSRITVWGAN